MMDNSYMLSVILPAYNEGSSLEGIIKTTNNFLLGQKIFKKYEIIVVNDGSKDNSSCILKKLEAEIECLNVVTHSVNLGYGKAVMSGVNNSKYSLLLFMDADGQFNIDSVSEMVKYISIYDIIAGYRYNRRDSLYRIVLGKINTFLMFFLFGLKSKDINCGFKILKRKVILSSYKSNGGLFYTEILLKAKNKGFKIMEIPVEHFPRLKGKATGGSWKVIIEAVKDMIGLLRYKYSKKTGMELNMFNSQKTAKERNGTHTSD